MATPFEFDKDGINNDTDGDDDLFGTTGTYHVISITDGDATFPLVQKLTSLLNGLFVDPEAVDPENPQESLFAYTVDDRIYLPLATEASVTTQNDVIALEGAPGVEDESIPTISIMPMGGVRKKSPLKPQRSSMKPIWLGSYAEGGVVDYSEFLTTLKLDGSLITFSDYAIEDPGPHAASNDIQPGDDQDASSDPNNLTGTHYYSNLGGQDNAYEGFYIDDIVIGFAGTWHDGHECRAGHQPLVK